MSDTTAPSRLTRRARNESTACDHPHCGRSRHKFGRYCVDHALTYERTGHPAGDTIRRGTWAPFVATADAFVTQQLLKDHKGIEEAIRWCARELYPTGVVYRRGDPRRPYKGYGAALGRARRLGVEPTELLARSIAAQLADDRGDASRPLFRSDAHHVHQSARMFLAALPFKSAGYARRKREHDPAPEPIRIPFRVRVYAYNRVNAAIGILAIRAAATIKRRLASDTPPKAHGPVEGSSAPFISNSTHQDTP